MIEQVSPQKHLELVRVDYLATHDSNGDRITLWCTWCAFHKSAGHVYTSVESTPTLIELNSAAAQHIHNGVVAHNVHSETAE